MLKRLEPSEVLMVTRLDRLARSTRSSVAEVERELIKARTSDGRARARAHGVHMGRPSPKLSAYQRQEALRRLSAGEAPISHGRRRTSRDDRPAGIAILTPIKSAISRDVT